MFSDYEDVEAYEDEIYREASSSEESIDSEVECHLYSQVHYSQDLSFTNEQNDWDQEEANELKTEGKSGLMLCQPDKPKPRTELIVLSDTDCVQISSGPEVVTLSDTTEDDSVYRSKGIKKVVSSHSHVKHRPYKTTGQSTPKYANARVLQIVDSTDPEDAMSKICVTTEDDTFDKSSLTHEFLVVEESSDEEEGECSSEEDEKTSTSESDDLENWMLLGDNQEDGDKSIQLNIEGCETSAGEGERAVEWSIGDKDLEAQISNYTPFRRMNHRYYTLEKNIICRNCDKRGHLSKNCSVSKKLPACCLCGARGHLQNSCPARFCSNCFLPGHFSKECIEKSYWRKECHRCSMAGHYADGIMPYCTPIRDILAPAQILTHFICWIVHRGPSYLACPEIWRQYHLTVQSGPIQKSIASSKKKAEMYCCNCARRGHYGHECSERRMYNGNFPASPFICSYDREHDIWKRDQRMVRKMQELQEAGLLPVAIKKPRWKNENSHSPPRKKKRHREKERKKGHRDDERHTESKKKSRHERDKVKKHKKPHAPWGYNMDQDFPRGTSLHSHKHKSQSLGEDPDLLLLENVEKAQVAGWLLEEGKKKKKKYGRRRDYIQAADESLFSIKQRHKKSRKHSS